MDLMEINKKKFIIILAITIVIILGNIFVDIIYPSRKLQSIFSIYVFLPLFLIAIGLSINILYERFYLNKKLKKRYLLIAFLPIIFILKIISSIWI